MNTREKIFRNIDKVILFAILVVSTIFMRNVNATLYINAIISGTMIIYTIIRLIGKTPIKIVKSRFDLFVFVFVLSPIVPLIFGTYVSLYAIISHILGYMVLFWIYILVREICYKNETNIKNVKNLIIIITLILIFIGIDNLTTDKIFELFDVKEIVNGEDRLVSLFGNPNIFSSFIMLALFISLNEMINSEKVKNKIIYGTCNTILILGIILTYSKLVFLLLPLMLVFYMIKVKDKSKNVYIPDNTLVSIVLSGMYIIIVQKICQQQTFGVIWIFTPMWICIAILFNILIEKINIYVQKIKVKTIVLIGALITVILAVFLYIELHNKKEFVVFYEDTIGTYNAKRITNIEPNKKYVLEFDMNVEAFEEEVANRKDLFKIVILQRGNKSTTEEIARDEYVFGNFSGNKKIIVQTTDKTEELKIEFISKYESISKSWVINNLSINGEDVILEYKHLPTKLVEKIKDININFRTAQERLNLIKDALKLISQNWITGIGADGWISKYSEVQEYGYVQNDTHSYYTQVWLEHGIVGIISIAMVVFMIVGIKYTDEKEKKMYMGIQLGILAILLHSALDSDMYRWYMRVILFYILGIVSTMSHFRKNEKQIKLLYITNTVIILTAIIVAILMNKVDLYNYRENVQKIETLMQKEKIGSQEFKEYSKK